MELRCVIKNRGAGQAELGKRSSLCAGRVFTVGGGGGRLIYIVGWGGWTAGKGEKFWVRDGLNGDGGEKGKGREKGRRGGNGFEYGGKK